MPGAKRSRNSRARGSAKRSNISKANSNSAVTNGKHLASEDENVEQEIRAAKRTKTEQTSARPERWTPYFKSKRLHDVEDDGVKQSAAAGDEQSGDSKGLEATAMQECQSIRRALIEVIGPHGKPLNLEKLRAEFDTGADDCMMTQSCYLQLKELLRFETGEADIEGVTKWQERMTQYVELNFNIGSLNFPPVIKFWVNEALPEDAGFDVLLSGPFLAYHNVIYIDPKLQQEIRKAGSPDLKTQKHFDFLGQGVVRSLSTKAKAKAKSHWN